MPDPSRTTQLIYNKLLELSQNGVLPKGAKTEVAKEFDKSVRTVDRIWSKKLDADKKGTVPDFNDKRKGISGRKFKWDVTLLYQKMKRLHLEDRGTLRRLAYCLKIPVSTLKDYKKKGLILKHVVNAKPQLTPFNKLQRLIFAKSFVLPSTRGQSRFNLMMDTIHLDEKWFYMAKVKRKVYLFPGEKTPTHRLKSKRYIGKIMFLVAVARPRHNTVTNAFFDGKIGIWSFTEWGFAQRNSRNRARGTRVLKTYNVTSESYQKMLKEQVIPEIKRKWPGRRGTVFLQHDNAPAHTRNFSAELLQEMHSDGWDIRIRAQPPNSPDFNILDLGFFNALQALQEKRRFENLEEMKRVVEECFEYMNPFKLEKNFYTLMKVMEQTMLCGGDNSFKIKHIAKEKLCANNMLPYSLICSQEALDKANETLGYTYDANDLEAVMQDLEFMSL